MININMLKCSRCKCARYCSVRCQTEHWTSVHKRCCRDIAARFDSDNRRGARQVFYGHIEQATFNHWKTRLAENINSDIIGNSVNLVDALMGKSNDKGKGQGKGNGKRNRRNRRQFDDDRVITFPPTSSSSQPASSSSQPASANSQGLYPVGKGFGKDAHFVALTQRNIN